MGAMVTRGGTARVLAGLVLAGLVLTDVVHGTASPPSPAPKRPQATSRKAPRSALRAPTIILGPNRLLKTRDCLEERMRQRWNTLPCGPGDHRAPKGRR